MKAAARLLNVDVIQVGEKAFAGSIISVIRNSIAQADAMLAVVTEENGNVYYEIGLAHCQHKPVVLLTADAKTLKFDLRDHRAIVYDPKNPAAVRDELVRVLKAALDSPSDAKSFLASALGGPDNNAAEAQLRAVQSVVALHQLQEPVTLASCAVLQKDKQLALEVEDFFHTRIRAVLDINGIVVSSKKVRGA